MIMTEVIDERENRKQSKFGPNRYVTDIIFNVVLGLALISFFFKLMHWPGGGLGMALVALLSLLLVLGQFIEGVIRKNASRTLLVISGSFLLVFFAFRLQYWPGGGPIFLFTALLFIIGIILHVVKKQQFSVKHWIIISMAGLALYLSRIEASDLYYSLNLSDTMSGSHKDEYVLPWRQYAHILYAEGKREESLEAMDTAIRNLEAQGVDSEDVLLQDLKNERAFMAVDPDALFNDLRKNLR